MSVHLALTTYSYLYRNSYRPVVVEGCRTCTCVMRLGSNSLTVSVLSLSGLRQVTSQRRALLRLGNSDRHLRSLEPWSLPVQSLLTYASHFPARDPQTPVSLRLFGPFRAIVLYRR